MTSPTQLPRPWTALLATLVALAAVCATASEVRAAPVELQGVKGQVPKRVRQVDVQEKLENEAPLNLAFKDENGADVTLRDFVDGERPIILTMNYSDCPMLCNLQLNALVKGMKQMDWTAGKEFQIVTVSLNPLEEPPQALKSKNSYVRSYGRPEAQKGWHFLTGKEQNIRALADGLGIKYTYNEARDEWLHPAAIVLITPDGRIARYLYGLEYPGQTLRLGLVESSQGKIGTTVDRFILYCFHYDSSEGRYAPVAKNIMKVGGGATALLLGGFLGTFWFRELRKKKRKERQAKPAADADDNPAAAAPGATEAS